MFAVITDQSVGGTFLTWTIYYLSGRTDYFSSRQNATIPLVESPLTEKNAHAFVVNQPWHLEEFYQFLPGLIDKDECMYVHQFRSGTKPAVDQLCSVATKIVVLWLPNSEILYRCGYHHRTDFTKAWCSSQTLSDPDDIYQDFVNYFYAESKQKWDQENLHDIWDQREFIALNFNPFDHSDSILNYVNQKPNCYHITSTDLWLNFDSKVHDLFEYLGLAIDESRFQPWLSIYSQWKNNHHSRIKFCRNFDTIVDNILNGIDFDLLEFNLDIAQEAAIQHVLIYKHNLNLKTWQLIKFTNTKQLYNLLEPNTHDLSKSQLQRLTA